MFMLYNIYLDVHSNCCHFSRVIFYISFVSTRLDLNWSSSILLWFLWFYVWPHWCWILCEGWDATLNSVPSCWRIAFISGCCAALLQAGTDWAVVVLWCCGAVVALLWCCGAVALSPPWLQTSYSTLQLHHHLQHQSPHCTAWLLKCDGKTLTLHASTFLILSCPRTGVTLAIGDHTILLSGSQASQDGVGIYFCEICCCLKSLWQRLWKIFRGTNPNPFNIHKIFSWDIVTFIILKFLRWPLKLCINPNLSKQLEVFHSHYSD